MGKIYPKKRSRKKKSLKAMIFGGLFFCSLAGLAYFLVWSPYFWVSRIEFEPDKPPRYYRQDDVKKIVQEVLDDKIWHFIPRKSVFLFPAEGIRSGILVRYPEIKSVKAGKKFPNAVRLAIEERTGVGIWCQLERPTAEALAAEEAKISTSSPDTSGILPKTEGKKIGQCFTLDQEGVIYRESALIEGDFVLNIFSGKAAAPPRIGDEVASWETMDFILKLKDGLPGVKPAGGLSLSAANFEIVSAGDLRVKTSVGFEIYFNPGYSIGTQLGALQMVLDNEIKENYVSLEYIDLRIEGRVYYQ
ncbi:MAG: hypothetical protein CO003_01795 [Candidatus Portnoybacteria bacterium CG_4_8_14_3_um_filter_44_15]|uniref:Uncharacterized protein n=1 Tax=Candidatus Portnoybacteria bacterium CG_4_8_14_3_um_filter_44_15 TaxID=1974803 RepID=A0A2M7IDN3_9BACT|nr:MAG: hypothetical protein CO003_01795 [Candidatus Portnoybacteria bacterium CG_4_8_14_3_um_filter_44_15]